MNLDQMIKLNQEDLFASINIILKKWGTKFKKKKKSNFLVKNSYNSNNNYLHIMMGKYVKVVERDGNYALII